MRQRYYNSEIKRFVNQDILTGSIGNSQSLNRYSYVQGNPVSYTDPFGLSPLNGMFSGTMFIHTVLGLIGWIPGPVGAVANLIDGIVYAIVDKDYKNAFFSFGSAVTFGTGKIVAAVGKGSKTALRVQRVCDFAGSAVNFAQSADGTYQTASMMAEKYIVQGQPFSGSTVLEVGLLAANIFGAYKSGTYALNDVADFGSFAKQSWTAWKEQNGIPSLAQNNAGAVDIDAYKSGTSSVQVARTDFIVTPEGVAISTKQDYNLVSTTRATDEGGEYLQIHNLHMHDTLSNPHTHRPQVNIDPISGRGSSVRLAYETTAQDINYMDQAMRNGSLRVRTGKKDKGGY